MLPGARHRRGRSVGHLGAGSVRASAGGEEGGAVGAVRRAGVPGRRHPWRDRSFRPRGRASGVGQEGERALIVEKPWGKVTTYALNQPSSVRIITIEPAQETSVHYHQLRDEM